MGRALCLLGLEVIYENLFMDEKKSLHCKGQQYEIN